eukprot:1153142-Pelagomonas_calceolata.AAC.1
MQVIQGANGFKAGASKVSVTSGRARSRLSRAALFEQWREMHGRFQEVTFRGQEDGVRSSQSEHTAVAGELSSMQEYTDMKNAYSSYAGCWSRLRIGPGPFATWISK